MLRERAVDARGQSHSQRVIGPRTDISAGCAALVTASTAWGVTMGTRSAGLEMEPRRRGDLIMYLCACTRLRNPVAQ